MATHRHKRCFNLREIRDSRQAQVRSASVRLGTKTCGDGVYVEEGRILRFQESMPPTDVEMADCSDHRSVCPSLLARNGVLDDLGMGERFVAGG
jgi:hypothetical protein